MVGSGFDQKVRIRNTEINLFFCVFQVPLGTPYLRAGAMHLGKYCETKNNEFMLCRQAALTCFFSIYFYSC